jgi:hypothetical protein
MQAMASRLFEGVRRNRNKQSKARERDPKSQSLDYSTSV